MEKRELRIFSAWMLAAAVLLGSLTGFFFIRLSSAELADFPPATAAMGSAGLSAQTPGEEEATLLAVGDVMLARQVETFMAVNGPDYPFREVKGFLNAGDITFGNLECSISERGTQLPGKNIWFRADPEVVQQLRNCGFDVMSIANNHSLDYLEDALLDTRQCLLDAGIRPVGGGPDLETARAPEIVTAHGVKFAFLAYTEMADMTWSSEYPRMLAATETQPGVAPLVPEQMIEDIRTVRGDVDWVVVSLHWGTEMSHRPTERQREIAHRLIDSGADVIIGHHPHVVQGVEVYNCGLIAYSLGNFIFDQDKWASTREGLVLDIDFCGPVPASVFIYPVIITRGQPSLAETGWTRNLANDVRRYSAELGTSLEVDGSAGEPLALTVTGGI